MRTYQIIAATVASLVATTAIAAEAPQRFVYEGHTFEYQTAPTEGGRIITGREVSLGTPFRLVVKNGRVTGTSGNTPVSFRVREARGATSDIVTAAN